MSFVLQPWQLLLSIVAGWIHDHQQKIIEYQGTIIQVLLEKNGKERILLNDDQRRRLAVKGKVLGRKLLSEIKAFFTPDTLLRWHRELVAQKWDHSDKRRAVGRPPTPQEVVDRILQFVPLLSGLKSKGYSELRSSLSQVEPRKLTKQGKIQGFCEFLPLENLHDFVHFRVQGNHLIENS